MPAEFCFKVNDDFQNVIDAWNAGIRIAKDIIEEYGRLSARLNYFAQICSLLDV